MKIKTFLESKKPVVAKVTPGIVEQTPTRNGKQFKDVRY
jgi:hypothetical protein